ncbi:MAG: winged helix-turn-helix transcriptional regulator [Sciscionella sp.]
MLGRTYASENCSAARALESVGDRWSLLIIRNALYAGMTRFSEFQQSLGVATNVLASRLERFVADGLMDLADGQNAPTQHSYRLTEKGRELGPVIMALTQWGDRWAAPDGPPILFEHARCGGHARTTTGCQSCGHDIAPADVSVTAGPGAAPETIATLKTRPAAAPRRSSPPQPRPPR